MEHSSPHEHERSDDDSFEDAQELHSPAKSGVPVPTTRVEKTDDVPSHGEVPGTDAYEIRKSDAVPDQLEVVPEGTRSRSSSVDENTSSSRRASVPKMVVEKVDPASPSHGEVPGTEAHAMRQADAEPDEVLRAPDSAREPLDGTPTSSSSRFEGENQTRRLDPPETVEPEDEDEDEGVEGDDFDDFAEGGDDDDFGEFDEGDPGANTAAATLPTTDAADTRPKLMTFEGLDSPEAIAEACQPFLDEIFPREVDQDEASVPPVSNSFLNERSHSLWSQLMAPPALQPPNWVRSRTRRLFLVSLGVPVDLDEILPASKQKKLVLPSIDIEQERSSTSNDGAVPNGSVSKLKKQNSSSTSVARSGSKSERKRKGPAPPPDFDANQARLLCSTTSQALSNLSDEELKEHQAHLEGLKKQASEALQYWLIQRDSANGDKEAFEEVIQNLVKHAQKIRT